MAQDLIEQQNPKFLDGKWKFYLRATKSSLKCTKYKVFMIFFML